LPFTVTPLFEGRTFDHPVQLVDERGDGAWLVVLHRGVVERVRDGKPAGSPILDIRDRVQFGKQWGLQQIALHPNYPNDPRLFATYFAARNVSKLSSFRSADGGRSFDAESEVVLLSEAQPSPWHPVGGLAFGPDGLLYVGWGFGALYESDPKALRGKVLRLDVDRSSGDRGYAIPRDNPFIDGDVVPETFAVGLRNPWRFAFDRATGELWLGDVGESGYEEINRITSGADYGWPSWEGTTCRLAGRCKAGTSLPVHAHANSDMCAVVGGYVYRGARFEGLRGQYVYADACNGTIYALDAAQEPPAARPVARTGLRIASFGEDRRGELYVVVSSDQRDASGGNYALYELAANAVPVMEDAEVPPLLSATGCIADGGFADTARGMVRYSIAMPAWHEGAEVLRFISDQRFWPRVGVENALSPRPGSILLNTFIVEDQPVETQMLVKRADGTWDGYDYRWNADGSDAELLDGAATAELGDGRRWSFPGSGQCFRCHDTRAGLLLGFNVAQLNTDVNGKNQIAWLEDFGMLEWTWRDGELPVAPRLDDATLGIDARARAYLDANCAHCHQPGAAGAASALDLKATTPFALTGLCNASPSAVMPGREDALLLAPGEPERSLISIRMHAGDTLAMPPGRRAVDVAGTAVVDEWIRSLRDCRG
jgi:glucose/arabinose dehydrogenase